MSSDCHDIEIVINEKPIVVTLGQPTDQEQLSGILIGVEENPIEVTVSSAPGPQGPTGPQGPAGPGVPILGTTGQVLKKVSNTNYDTEWADPTAVTSIAWGGITGDITNQTDLNSTIEDFYKRDNYTHIQNTPSDTWVILHNMGKRPSVSIVDTAEDEVEAEIKYDTNNQITITFSAAMSGKAFLN